MTDDNDRPPTRDERRAMDWWKALTDEQRRDLLTAGDGRIVNPSAAELWNLLIAKEISGPPLPSDAKPLELPPVEAWRRRGPKLRAFHCPCCYTWLGSFDPSLPGLIWCRACKLEIETKPCPNPPIV